jgi:hypothetical protein
MAKEPELSVELTVNGKNVECNEFVRKVTGNVFWAIIKSLHLETDPQTATINIKVK